MKRFLSILAMLLMGLVALTACSEAKSYPSEIQYVVGKGGGDAHKIKHVVYPGEKVKIDGDEESWYVPGNARNFIIKNSDDSGDRKEPVVAYTAGDPNNPAMQVKIYLSAYWALNQNEDVLRSFLPFCEKYTCYSKDHDDNDSNFASKGWNGMLAENFSPAIDRAVNDVIKNFNADLWANTELWNDEENGLATQIESVFMAEIKKSWATESDKDFFCGNGSATRDKAVACEPIRFVIDSVQPYDSRVVQIKQDQSALEQQKLLNQQKLEQAKLLYGDKADYTLSVMDLMQRCADLKLPCTIVIGADAPSVIIDPPKTE